MGSPIFPAVTNSTKLPELYHLVKTCDRSLKIAQLNAIIQKPTKSCTQRSYYARPFLLPAWFHPDLNNSSLRIPVQCQRELPN